MRTFRSRLTFLAALLALAVAPLAVAAAKPAVVNAEAKRLADRYALTKARINALLGPRLHPTALPAGVLPNPFYRPLAVTDTSPTNNPAETETPAVPDTADLSDIDTLTKYTATLKLSGYLVLGGQPHISINSAICKVGDTVTVGTKDKPIFLHIDAITPQELTLRLNETTYTVPLRK